MDARLERLRTTLVAAIAGMSAEQLQEHPEGKWCAAEVLEHLYLTYTGTMKGFERVNESGSPMATPQTWRNRLSAWVVNGLGHIPEGRKAPAPTQPKGLPREIVVREFGARIAEMDEVISRCELKFGSNVKLLDHPFLGPLTASEWRKFHLVHGRHHARQIRKLRTAAKSS